MAEFSSGQIACQDVTYPDKGYGHVWCNIYKISSTRGRIDFKFYFTGYLRLAANISKASWSYSCPYFSYSYSEPPGTYGSDSAWKTYNIAPGGADIAFTTDFDLPIGEKSTTLNFSFVASLPYQEQGKTSKYSYSGSIGITIPSGYTAPSNVWGRINSSTHNSFNITVGWTQGTNSGTAYITDVASAGRDVAIGTNPSGSTGNTIADATPNKEYGIYAWVHDGTSQVFGLSNSKYWTHPYLENPTLSLVSGNEHDQIKVVANNNYKSNYDKYAFKLDDGSWTDWQDSNEYIFSRSNYPTILGMTNHTIYTKVKNTSSNFESVNQPSASITTWYDPIYDLSVLLINRWFWYLEINSQVDYQGGYENITKYEFDIGSQGYTDKGTNNTYNRGSIDPKASNKLNYNTDYLCKVRVTDNHGRTKEASATYRTLDERPLYVNGVLREVKIIKSDGSIEYVTPNLLTVVKSDGTTVNMNKIINNDNRTSYQ